MGITLEQLILALSAVFTIVVTLVAATWAIRNKIDEILQRISDIQKDYVTHEVCEKRRAQGACGGSGQ